MDGSHQASIASLPKQSVDAEQTFRFISGRFVKQEGTMGTLASQRQIGVCVQAPGRRRASSQRTGGRNSPHPPQTVVVWAGVGAGSSPSRYGGVGYHPRKIFEILYAKSCNVVHFWPENGPFRSPIYCPFWAFQTIVLQTDWPLSR